MRPTADVGAIRRHLEFVAGPQSLTMPDCKLEIAWGLPEDGPNRAQLFRSSELAVAAEFAAAINEAGHNLYVGATLKRAGSPSNRRTSNEHAAVATCMAIDIDSDLVPTARKLPVKPHLLVLTGSKPSARGHLWIRVIPTADLALWDDINSRAVALVGGDMGARGRSRVMRLGGTVSYPTASKRLRGYEMESVSIHAFEAASYELARLGRAFPPLAQQNLRSPSAAARQSQPTQLKVALADVQSALAALPPCYSEDHELWLRIGFALHSFDRGSRGLTLWMQFSERCPSKAALTDFESRWASFNRPCDRRPITIRWLFAQAMAQGWRPPRTGARYGRRR